MKEPIIESAILKLTKQNKNGVAIDIIIEYLDYINKVRYTKKEIVPVLDKLSGEGKIKFDGSVYKL